MELGKDGRLNTTYRTNHISDLAARVEVGDFRSPELLARESQLTDVPCEIRNRR